MSKHDRLDDAIDRAVREMLDVEPPSGLRGRVLDRIENAGTRGWSWIWIAAPVAAAAILVLAVLTPSENDRLTVAPPAKVARDVHLMAPVLSPVPHTRPPVVMAKSGARPPRADGLIVATVVSADPAVEAARVEALPGPEPLAIDRLSGPARPSVNDLGVAPIQIRALEVSALTETPQGRREE
jgi:hypothetical protein